MLNDIKIIKSQKNKQSELKYVYILSNSQVPDVIKIGQSYNPESRAKELSKQTGTIGEFTVAWKVQVEGNPERVEKALHYKLKEFNVGKEYFRIDKKIALKICRRLVKELAPHKNPKASQYKILSKPKTAGKTGLKKASSNLWNEVLNSDSPKFVKNALKLCLKEGRLGQPQYRRFSSIRRDMHTEIGPIDLYILKKHLRIVTYTINKKKGKEDIIKRMGKNIKILPWLNGLSFFITSQSELNALNKWIHLGVKPLPNIS